MAVPTYQECIPPLLGLIQDGKVHKISDLRPLIAEELNVSDEDLAELLPSGKQSKFTNRVSWASIYLVKSGLASRPLRAHIQINEEGRKVIAKPPEKFDQKFFSQFPGFLEFQGKSKGKEQSVDNQSSDHEDSQTPEEQLHEAYITLRNDLAGELLDQIKSMSPRFFEKLVLDLMEAMGYGGTENPSSLTSGGADEGIDGIINEDRLGLDIIYLQAKRWEKQVSRPEIQKFVGALHGKRARKGVFLTTSTFSKEAHEYVSTIEPKVILIDGQKLANYMIDFNVGVSTAQTFRIKRVDSDYFLEE